jgi:hypothetical protein
MPLLPREVESDHESRSAKKKVDGSLTIPNPILRALKARGGLHLADCHGVEGPGRGLLEKAG